MYRQTSVMGHRLWRSDPSLVLWTVVEVLPRKMRPFVITGESKTPSFMACDFL